MALAHVASLPDGVDHLEEAWAEALRLRDLLKFEFFFADKADFRAALEAEAALMAPAWGGGELEAGQAARALDRLLQGHGGDNAPVIAGPLVAHHVLRSFVDAQLVAAEVLVALGDAATTADALVEAALALGKQLVRQRRIHGVESVSRELFSGCASLAANRGLLDGTPEGRRAWHAEVVVTLDRLDRIRDLEVRTGVAP
jgi:glycerol-3-phosphate O-acyltransferase